jgi:hypothetical protein
MRANPIERAEFDSNGDELEGAIGLGRHERGARRDRNGWPRAGERDTPRNATCQRVGGFRFTLGKRFE